MSREIKTVYSIEYIVKKKERKYKKKIADRVTVSSEEKDKFKI